MRFSQFLLAITLLGSISFPAGAIGERGHSEIGRMMVEDYLKSDTMLPGLAALFENENNIRALYSGCAFPDWGYGLGYQGAAEYSHWHPFMERYVTLLQQRFPLPWDAEAQRQICFFFGVVVHNISDIPWHFTEDGHKSFLKAGLDADGAGHGEIEFACDIFLHAERTLEPSVQTEAWFPIDLLLDVFDGSGQKVSREGLEQGTLRSRIMFFGGELVGTLQKNSQKKRMPWVYDHYFDYYYGGLEHGAAVTAEVIRYYYARLTGSYYFQNTPEYAPYVRHKDGYVPRLQISDAHLMADHPDHNAGAEPFLEIGGSGKAQRVGLIHVNMEEVKPGFDLDTARLRLYCTDVPTTPVTLSVYRVLKPWQEGAGVTDDVIGADGCLATADEACWQRSGAASWALPGCAEPDKDYAPAPVDSITIQEAGNWVTLDITSATKHWLSHPGENHGLLLRLEAEQEKTPVARFYSSEAFKGCADGLCGGKRVAFRPAFVLLPK